MHEKPLLSLDGVTKAFGGLITIDELSLTIRPGERRAILGPNGAGKTTLFNLVSGRLRPSAGQIFYNGSEITHMSEHHRTAIGISRTFQITSLFGRLTVMENVLLAILGLDERKKFMMLRSLSSYKETNDRARELLKKFEIEDKREEIVKNLSYGDQRKIEIALALAGSPRLLLLDEPTAGLSPGETYNVSQFLKTLDPRITILLIEHDMDVAFAFCEHISVLHFGKLLVSGTREEITNNPSVQDIYLGKGLESHYA